MQSVMGAIPGMMASMTPDPSHKIPPEARGRVRRKKKSSSGGAHGSSAAASANGGVGRDPTEKDRTFVTNKEFAEEDG